MRDRELSTLRVVEGRGPRGPNEVVIDKGSADDAGYRVGDTVPVITKAGRNDYTLSGIVKFGSENSLLGATIAAFTPNAATRLLGTPGQFQSIDVKADPGVSQDQVVADIRASLKGEPGTQNVEVISGEDITAESQSDLKDNLSFFNTFLLIFGIVALLVGSFIIFNTFSIVVAQRSRELALLRAIGAGQRQVLGSVLFEAVLVGLVASTVGLRGRHLPRRRAQGPPRGPRSRHPGQRHRDPCRRIHLVLRARHGRHRRGGDRAGAACRAHTPDRGDRDSSIDRSSTSPRRAVIGIIVSLVGLAFLLLGLFGDSGLLYVGLGMAIVFLGVAVLGPMIAAPISGALGIPIQKIKGVTGVIAARTRSATRSARRPPRPR